MKNSALILVILLSTLMCGCNVLKPVERYCEIAIGYPDDEPLPELLEYNRIGCACTTKDIIKGRTTKAWTLHPLEDCMRVRGFHPSIWTGTIDPYFRYNYEKHNAKFD